MTPAVLRFSEEYRSAWSAFVSDSEAATVCHDIGWRDILSQSLGHEPKYLLAMRDDAVTGVLPLFLVKTWWRSKYLISIPWLDYGGVCAKDQPSADALLDAARQQAVELGAQFVEMRSVTAASDNLPQSENRVTFRLKLASDPDELWRAFNAKLRNQIRKSEKSGLTTEIGREEHLEEFYQVFCCNMRDLGTPVWGLDLFARTLREFPDKAKIILVKSGSQVVAGGLILQFKDSVYIPSASAYRESRRFCPNHAMYWRAIADGCRDGFSYFDFGRSAIDSSTFKFKKQWTPEPTALHWQYILNTAESIPEINPRNPKYRFLTGVWSRLPLRIANCLGPRVIRNFP